jgi:hypothetical protein
VLVRRYQNQGITLTSRAGSPSEASASTPHSMYPPDDDYSSFLPNDYDSLMPPHTQGTSAGSHRSWSSMDSEALSTWSSPQDYTLPMTTADMTHATDLIPEYAFTAPRTLASNDWDWTPNPSTPMQAQSPISYNTISAPQHYDNYAMAHPPTMSRSYSRSPGRATYPSMTGAAPTNMHVPGTRARAWSGQEQQQQQHHYDSLAPTSTYPDPRQHQHNPLYRF